MSTKHVFLDDERCFLIFDVLLRLHAEERVSMKLDCSACVSIWADVHHHIDISCHSSIACPQQGSITTIAMLVRFLTPNQNAKGKFDHLFITYNSLVVYSLSILTNLIFLYVYSPTWEWIDGCGTCSEKNPNQVWWNSQNWYLITI